MITNTLFNHFPALLNRTPLHNYSSALPKTTTLSKIAAIGLTVFLGLSYFKYYISERFGYNKYHPESERLFLGFGPLKKVPILGPFYHATQSEKILLKILSDGAVKVSHYNCFPDSNADAWNTNREFRAFVSTVPEFTEYGKYALVFRDNIREHPDGSPRAFAQSILYPHMWIAFTENLPTDETYLEKILLKSKAQTLEGKELERSNLEKKIYEIFNRKIIVELSQLKEYTSF